CVKSLSIKIIIMKALVYNGPGKKSWEEKPRPSILHSTDAVVKIYKTTICGTDLHIVVLYIFTTASVECKIEGLGFSSHDFFPGPLYTNAFIIIIFIDNDLT